MTLSRREARNAYMRDYYQRNKEEILELRKRPDYLNRRSDWRLRQDHGITRKEYERIYETQGRVCALCRNASRKPTGQRRPLNVDHCHDTGRLRGLLCGPCNTALGRLGDSETALERALAYVRGALQMEGIQHGI